MFIDCDNVHCEMRTVVIVGIGWRGGWEGERKGEGEGRKGEDRGRGRIGDGEGRIGEWEGEVDERGTKGSEGKGRGRWSGIMRKGG